MPDSIPAADLPDWLRRVPEAVRVAGRYADACRQGADLIERLAALLRAATPIEMGGSPDLAFPDCGHTELSDHDQWGCWQDQVHRAIDQPRPQPDVHAEYERLRAKRDRLIASGVDSTGLNVPIQPRPELAPSGAGEGIDRPSCTQPIWDAPYRMTCGYVLVHGKCVRHGQQANPKETPDAR